MMFDDDENGISSLCKLFRLKIDHHRCMKVKAILFFKIIKIKCFFIEKFLLKFDCQFVFAMVSIVIFTYR